MKFVFFSSLKPGAKKAIQRGIGKYRKYAIDKANGQTYIAMVKNGRIGEWVHVIQGGAPIEGIPA